jgi:hypothetical protein
MGFGWSGQAPPDSSSIAINPIFSGRMIMGDIGDLKIASGEEGSDRFVYAPTGSGPHEWDYKFINGEENRDPAGFAGVMYINSMVLSEPGARATDGKNLRQWRQKIVWEARAIGGDAKVEFVAGGITWAWDLKTRKTVSLPFGDTLPKLSLGSHSIGRNWTPLEFDLNRAHLAPESFDRVIGAFGFVIKASESKRPVTIEIRDVRYLGSPEPPAPAKK